MRKGGKIEILGLAGMPMVREGDDLVQLLLDALAENEIAPVHGDVIVIAQKIISKSLGLTVVLSSVTPGPEALELAHKTGKDPRFVELVLSQSNSIVRVGPNLLIGEHVSGHIAANVGIDQSNVEMVGDEETCLLLPHNPDEIAVDIQERLEKACSCSLGVVIADSFGRPWRIGTVGVAIGAAGFECLQDECGKKDLVGRELQATYIARADELAACASLAIGQAAEGVPAALVRNAPVRLGKGSAADLLRPREMDVFR